VSTTFNAMGDVAMVNNSNKPGTYRARLASRMALSLIAWSTLAAAPALGQSSTDPRAFGAIALPELGRLDGQLRCIVQDERFGRQIYAIGDVDGDSLNDWIGLASIPWTLHG
jgi:hypothetical protein